MEINFYSYKQEILNLKKKNMFAKIYMVPKNTTNSNNNEVPYQINCSKIISREEQNWYVVLKYFKGYGRFRLVLICFEITCLKELR